MEKSDSPHQISGLIILYLQKEIEENLLFTNWQN